MKIKHLIFAFLCLSGVTLSAQDFQYSYYQFSPISYNPAFTGAFYGNIRVNAMIRDQLRTVAPANNTSFQEVGVGGGVEYQTLSISIDGNLPFGFKEGDWISAGINIAKDEAGDLDYKHSFNGISAAYHMTLGKKQNAVLTLGAKYGKYGKGITSTNVSDYLSPYILSGQINDLDVNNLTAQGQDLSIDEANDFMVGLLLSAPMGDNSDIRIGISSDHLLAPTLRVSQQMGTSGPITQRLDRRINGVVQFYTDLTDNITFNPSLVFQSMGESSNILVQSLFSYHMPGKDDLALTFGLGYRMSDNSVLPFYMGADMKDMRIGISYAINMGGLSGAGREGGFELGLTKIFSWNKKAKVKPIFVCPRL